jgi:preprotein translocase SecE subunit
MASEAIETTREKKSGISDYVGEIREELRKTSFPSGDDVRNTTIIVIINVLFFAVFLFFIDQGWAYLLLGLEWVINKAS